MIKLYTGNGDGGYTETLSDKHISKGSALVELIGTLDELSACLGIAGLHTENDMLLRNIKNLRTDMISVMGELAGGKRFADKLRVKALEELTDKCCIGFDGFSVKEPNSPSAYLNLARCVARRAERAAVRTNGGVSADMLAYLNRLSDLLYAMSRYAEDNE